MKTTEKNKEHRPHYFVNLFASLQNIKGKITCRRYGFLIIYCALNDQGKVKDICKESGIHNDDYVIVEIGYNETI